MVSQDLQMSQKWGPNRYLKSSKSLKRQKHEIQWKPQYLLCFWEVETSRISWFSNQKSSKTMPAIQTCFLTPQITENIKKWLKMVSNGGPKIHQKSSQTYPGTHKWPPECILAPLGHQNASKEASTGPNVMPKWCQRGRRQGAEPMKYIHM